MRRGMKSNSFVIKQVQLAYSTFIASTEKKMRCASCSCLGRRLQLAGIEGGGEARNR